MLRSRCCAIGFACVAVVAGMTSVGAARAEETETADADGSTAQREARLAAMRSRAAEFEVVRVVNGQRKRVPLQEEAVFRYTDQPRGFIDATLWCWTSNGRPVALSKVEAVKSAGAPSWQFCVASLADGPIEVRFANGNRLSSNRAGITLVPFDQAPEPADRPVARLRQMKELVARFAATIHVDGKASMKQEMRLLPRPIHRYADSETGLVDGVIFGLTTNGTNPDMLIVIEVTKEGEADSQWKYGIAKMTLADVHIRLDQKEIYASRITEPRQTWTVFQIPRREVFDGER